MVSQEQARHTCSYRQVRSWKTWPLLQERETLFCGQLQLASLPIISMAARYIAYSKFLSKSPHRGSHINTSGRTCLLCRLSSNYCKYLIINEKSMIGIKFLGLLDHRLREIFPAHQNEMYAGINIFVCGDFHQLPPIGATVMHSNLPNARKVDFLAGQQAYRALDTTVRLTQLMRQDGDDDETLQFRLALEKLRVYRVSPIRVGGF